MKQHIIVIDPLSSGIELAPAFKARGIDAVAVTMENKEWPEFGCKLKASDFVEVIANHRGIENVIEKYNPLAIIAGTEEGIPLAECLTTKLLPQLSNDASKSAHRANKSLMQAALVEAGIPSLKTLSTGSEQEAEAWIQDSDLIKKGFIIKPPMSSGSEMVFHIGANDNWRQPFNYILNEPSVLTGIKSRAVVIQEQAIGPEYAVGTVSAKGNHHLAHLIRYHKTSPGKRRTIFDYVEFVPFEGEVMGELFEYTQKALDALGIIWGAAHTEIILTKDGPRLIESSARMIGGPVVEFARAATGSSQADKLVEIYLDGEVGKKDFEFKKCVIPVFLKAANQGEVSNLEILDLVSELPTFLYKHIWIKNGDLVPQTIDYLTSIGIIALTGERDAIFKDYKKIRSLESKLVFN